MTRVTLTESIYCAGLKVSQNDGLNAARINLSVSAVYIAVHKVAISSYCRSLGVVFKQGRRSILLVRPDQEATRVTRVNAQSTSALSQVDKETRSEIRSPEKTSQAEVFLELRVTNAMPVLNRVKSPNYRR